MHLGLDGSTGQNVAASLTAKEVDDGAKVGALLDQVAGSLASFTADGGGYDQESVYASVAGHRPEAAIIVPPNATAVPSNTAERQATEVEISVHALNRMLDLGRPSDRPLA